MIEFVRRHYIYLLYGFVLFCLFLGLVSDSGFRYAGLLLVYALSFGAFSFFLSAPVKSLLTKVQVRTEVPWPDKLAWGISAFILVVILIHYLVLREIPLFNALQSNDDVEIARIRNNIALSTPVWLNYTGSFVICSLLPFFIYYFYVTRQQVLFRVLIFAGAFYTLSLIQKSYVITIFIPLWLYLLISKSYLRFAYLTLFFMVAISFLVITANPYLIGRGVRHPSGDTEQETDLKEEDVRDTETGIFASSLQIMKGVGERVFLVPGKVMSKWFCSVPSRYPYARGCAYHFAAPVIGCRYVDFPAVMYDQSYPKYAAKGLHGAMVAPSFMYDYVNFGVFGLVLSGFLLSMLFIVISFIFAGNFASGVALNFYFIIILVSAAISTLLFSGGWGLTIFLFFIYRDKLKKYA